MMKINKISIQNFGIYKGTYQYDFTVSSEKNVILISGKNGSGKTTLLNIVKLGLYGPKVFGYRTDTNPKYLQYIDSKLNAFARYEGISDYSIKLDFSFPYQGELKTFVVTRQWKLTNSSLKEEVSVICNEAVLSDTDKEIFFNHLHKQIPRSFFDLFFFDGEKIEDLFLLKNDLTNMFESVFNLELFLQLKQDLKKYMLQKNIFKTLDTHEQEKFLLEEQLENAKSELKNIQEMIHEQENSLIQMKDQLEEKNKDFMHLGGLQEPALEGYKKQIKELEEQKLQIQNEYKTLFLEYLPFIMVKSQIQNLLQEIQQEQKVKGDQIFIQKLKDPTLTAQLEKDPNFTTLGLMQFIDIIEKYIQNPENQNEILYDLTPAQRYELEHLYDLFKDMNYRNLLTLQEDIQKVNEQIRSLQTKIDQSTTDDLKNFMNEISALSASVSILQKEIEDLKLEESELKSQVSMLDSNLLQAQTQIQEVKKDGNISSIVDKIDRVITKYTVGIQGQKQKQLEDYVSNMFQSLIRKDDFISRIEVHPETHQFILYNKLGGILPKENLSAGEKQIYVLSILFGMIKISQQKVPLVFDTLLGRLDQSHKNHIINTFIKECGEQIIILATDSEIDEKYYELLKPILSQYYRIDYNSESNAVMLDALPIV